LDYRTPAEHEEMTELR